MGNIDNFYLLLTQKVKCKAKQKCSKLYIEPKQKDIKKIEIIAELCGVKIEMKRTEIPYHHNGVVTYIKTSPYLVVGG